MSQGTNQLLPFKMFEYFYTIERFNLISILSTNKIGVETDSISRLKEFLNPYSLSHYQKKNSFRAPRTVWIFISNSSESRSY